MQRKIFSPEMQHEIAWLCTEMTDKELSNHIKSRFHKNRSAKQIAGFRKRNRIKNGKTGYFHTPENPHSYPPARKGEHRSPRTEFKKGHRPKNTHPIGSVVVWNNKGWLQARVKIGEPNKWQPRAYFNWIKAGKPPLKKGLKLVHIDGNPLNDDVCNLRTVKDDVLLKVNTTMPFVKKNADFNSAVLTTVELSQKIKELEA